METKKKGWLEGLEAGEEIRGYAIPDGGMTGQGLLVRVKTGEPCPNHSPEAFGTDFVDDALINDVDAINLGLAVGTGLVIVGTFNNDGNRVYFDEAGTEHADNDETDGIRNRFNDGTLAKEHGEKAHYIRFTVQRREEHDETEEG